MATQRPSLTNGALRFSIPKEKVSSLRFAVLDQAGNSTLAMTTHTIVPTENEGYVAIAPNLILGVLPDMNIDSHAPPY